MYTHQLKKKILCKILIFLDEILCLYIIFALTGMYEYCSCFRLHTNSVHMPPFTLPSASHQMLFSISVYKWHTG